MLYKIKNLYLRNALYFVLLIVLVVPFCASMILYFTSKILRALSYALVFKRYSAKDELRDFWSINTSLIDAF